MFARRIVARWLRTLVLVLGFGLASLGLLQPATAHADTAGVIYIVDEACCSGAKAGIIRVDPTAPGGASQTIVSTGQLLGTPFGIALVGDGTLYVVGFSCCNNPGGSVIRVDPTKPALANQTLVSSGQLLKSAYSIVIAPDGPLYVVDSTCCGGNGGVIRIDPNLPTDSNQSVISSGQKLGARTQSRSVLTASSTSRTWTAAVVVSAA